MIFYEICIFLRRWFPAHHRDCLVLLCFFFLYIIFIAVLSVYTKIENKFAITKYTKYFRFYSKFCFLVRLMLINTHFNFLIEKPCCWVFDLFQDKYLLHCYWKYRYFPFHPDTAKPVQDEGTWSVIQSSLCVFCFNSGKCQTADHIEYLWAESKAH